MLWIQTSITTCFLHNISCILKLITQKLQVIHVHGHSTYRMTTLLVEMSIFRVIIKCEIQLVSYGSKHASQSLSNKPFVHTHMYNFQTTGHTCIWTITCSISNHCSTIRDIPCVVYSCGPRHPSVVL